MLRQASRRFFSSTGRVANFNAGPATLPVPVLEEAQRDLINWKGCGMGVMEMSHRSKEYDSIHQKATADIGELLNVPSNYKIMFVQGGASSQFASVPLNLISRTGKADYLVTGAWSKAAAAEGKRLGGDVNIAATGAETNFTVIPDRSTWNLTKDAAYLSFCDNETVHGVEFPGVPDVDALLVADMSSNFISKPVDVSKYGVIYAGAQKNVGPSGVTIVIVREDLIGNALPTTPKMLDWKTMADKESLYNTPPCWSIYMAGLVFDYTKKLGGLKGMQERNQEKANLLYSTIEGSDFFHSPVDPSCRSVMNVPFRIGKGQGDEAIEAKFVKESKAAGMEGLKGHRSVGGCRASIYNSVTLDNVQQLVTFMKDFETANCK
jgi:phosphoserine aminotransferase